MQTQVFSSAPILACAIHSICSAEVISFSSILQTPFDTPRHDTNIPAAYFVLRSCFACTHTPTQPSLRTEQK